MQYNEGCKKKIKLLPNSPGIYLLRDQDGQLLYIGKSKNIKQRVSSYFQNNSKDSERIQMLKKNIADFEIVYCETEIEALLFEDRMIKKYWPPYNIKQKEYLKYKYFKIEKEVPKIKIRDEFEEEEEWFGPFEDEYKILEILDCIGTALDFVVCKYNIREKKGCVQHSIGKCLAPCLTEEYRLLYQQRLRIMKNFLFGVNKELIKILQHKMQEAAKSLQFEKAANLRNHLAFAESFWKQKRIFRKIQYKFLWVYDGTWSYLFSRGCLMHKEKGKMQKYDICKLKELYTDKKLEKLTKHKLDEIVVIYSWLVNTRTPKEYKFL